jgi:chorismate mutase/prephenate dehydratase
VADDSQELGKLRDQIDAIDGELLRLINERAKLAHRIGEIKQGNIYRPEREAQVLRRVAERNPGPLPAAAAQRIVREVMSACLALEQPLTIAYLGPAGTYSESAARKHFGGAPTLLACPASTTCSASSNPAMPLRRGADRELDRRRHRPFAGPAAVLALADLRRDQPADPSQADGAGRHPAGATRIYSHAQSLAQCHEWLNRNLPQVQRVPVASNAEAARLAAAEAGGGGHRRRCRGRTVWPEHTRRQHRGRSEQHDALCRDRRPRCRPFGRGPHLAGLLGAEPAGRAITSCWRPSPTTAFP